MKAKTCIVAILASVALLAGCADYDGSEGYLPPDISGDTSGLTIADVPLGSGASVQGSLPDQGRYLGFVFQAQDQEVYDITLQRLSGTDVPALVLYRFQDENWSEPLAWASADAREIGINGWEVPGSDSYLALVEAVSGPGDSDFLLTLRCVDGCEDPVMCETDADCPENQVCWNGRCFDSGIECGPNSPCPPGEVCENGFCVAICDPQTEICDGLDNDCDGLVDEGCEQPCTSDQDCDPYEVCINGVCVAECECTTDAECPIDHQCIRCVCLPIVCTSDEDCAPDQSCVNGECITLPCDDLDSDGFLDCEDDCDDLDASVNPAAPEICDGVDNDCDGVVDEGCSQICTSDAECDDGDPNTYDYCLNGVCVNELYCRSDADCPAGMLCIDGLCMYDPCPDFDQDGWCTCDGDCDDYDASIHPGAPEACDGVDNNCDGVVDEGCEIPCDQNGQCPAGQSCCEGFCVDVLFDANNCGACGQVCAAGEVCVRGVCMADVCVSHEDCDDGDPNTYDYCINGQCIHEPFCMSDDDCPAGQVCMDGVCMYDPCPDVDQDGFTTCDGDCDDRDASIHPAAAEECDGLDNDCDGVVDEGCDCNCMSDADCDDGDPQTEDYCINCICVHR